MSIDLIHVREGSQPQLSESIGQYYRSPDQWLRIAAQSHPPAGRMRFRVGETSSNSRHLGREPSLPIYNPADLVERSTIRDGIAYLSFAIDEVMDDLRFERYASSDRLAARSLYGSTIRDAYYLVRPLLPVSVRKYLQRMSLNGWDTISFPSWPVDVTVDKLAKQLMLLALRASGLKRMPFIWFWPDGASGCAIMTHDVETERGRDYCSTLMDINDSFGIKSSFQVVPEVRYEVTPAYLDSIRLRGFEVNVQDLNHDGHLYRNHKLFLERVKKINSYGGEWGALGFRAGVLYRNEDWFHQFKFEYEMSVPNVAHLDPQRGGCCTVMPYFVGDILEIPVTTTQDYSLFHILKEYSLDLWKQQVQLIMGQHGLASFIIHPDYVISNRERTAYEKLLEYLSRLRDDEGVWLPTPREVNRWWRQRAKMWLVEDDCGWRIEGEGRARARVAYASEENGELRFQIDPASNRI